MNSNVSLALRCVVAALLLGVMSDALLRAAPWALNAAMVACALGIAVAWFAPAGRKRFALLIAMFGLFMVWRDSPVLKALDVLSIGAVLTTLALPPVLVRVARSTFSSYAVSALELATAAVIGMPSLVWSEMGVKAQRTMGTGRTRDALALAGNGAAGVLIAIPLLVVFGGLFASADEGFGEFVSEYLNIDWDVLFRHIFVVGFVWWTAAGIFRLLALNAWINPDIGSIAAGFRLHPLSVLVPLSLLNMLFATFVLFQLGYFFGGHSLITDPRGPSYSEYAREGFFQLVAVAVLALLVLYMADWLNRDSRRAARSWFQTLSGLFIVLVYLVMASALHRMYLYYQAYGLTQLRFYTTVFMIWLASILALFALTVVRGKRDRFAFPAVVTAWVAVTLLNVSNPGEVIVRANIARALHGEKLDAGYLGCYLSADAIPALIAAREQCAEPVKSGAEEAIAWWMRVGHRDMGDWRTWNWSREYAARQTSKLGLYPFTE